MMGAAFTAQKRQKREDTGIGRSAERQRGQRMAAPAERADDMAVAANRTEGGVQGCAAYRVEHDVEPASLCIACDIVHDRLFLVVDRRRAELPDQSETLRRTRRAHLRAECTRDLDRDMADAARAAMDQDLLSRGNMRAIDQAL